MAPGAASARTYQLHIRLQTAQAVTVGKLGRFIFPAGDYIYTGSARRNIGARIARHRRRDKRLRWHIDYLLASPGAEITRVETFTGPECALNRAIGGEIVANGFGASDCRAGCGSHLKKIA